MDPRFSLGAIIAIASAFAIAVLGLQVLRLQPNDGSARTFALFTFAWAVPLVAGNSMRMLTDVAVLRAAAVTFQAGLVVAWVPLLVFALTYPPSRVSVPPSTAWAVLGLPSLAALLAIVLEPSLFIEDVRVEGGRQIVDFGPLSGFAHATFGLSFLVGAGVIGYRLRRSSATGERSRLALVFSALLIYVSYQAGHFPSWVGYLRDSLLSSRGIVSYAVTATSLGLAMAMVVGVFVAAWRRRDLPWRRLAMAAAAIPCLATIAVSYARFYMDTTFGTAGLWRVAMVGIFGYALARYRLFDLELRLRDAAPVATYVATAGLGLGVLWVGFGQHFVEPWPLGVTASLGVAAIAWPSLRVAERVVDRRLGHLDEPTYLYQRKLEVYRSALADARARGLDPGERRFLAELRERLDISEDEHRTVLGLVDDEGPPERETEVSKFEVHEELGRGSLGRAVRATDTTLDREVVLKEAAGPWADQRRDVFVREAQLVARIDHPNVVQIYEVEPDREPPMLVLEHVEGGSLADRLDEEGALAPAEAVDVMLDALRGLEALHAEGIVHRDVKPDNVLLDADGRAKIADLDVARSIEPCDVDTALAAEGEQPGTVAYMSPEQARGDEVDARTDLYAAGATLYETLTGEHYLGDADEPGYVVRRRVAREPPALDRDEIPDPLVSFLEHALAKDPEDRFASAGQMRAELARVAERLATREPVEPARR